MNTDLLEIFKQMSFLSSVIAGFAITAALQLVPLTRQKKLVTATMAVFLLSGAILAVATTIFVLVLTALVGAPGWPQPSDEWIMRFVGGIGVIPLSGLLLFLAGIGMVGWLRSRLLGFITTTFAALASSLVVVVLWGMSYSQ